MGGEHSRHPFSEPLEHEGQEITLLSMRAPKVRDLRDSEKGGGTDGDKEIRLFANLCMVPPDVILKLAISDYREVQAACRSFTGGSA